MKIKPQYLPNTSNDKYDLSNFKVNVAIKPSTIQEKDLALIEKNKV